VRTTILSFALWLFATFAACSPGSDTARVFTTVVDGVAADRRTGLEWTSRDHEEALDWDAADRHCRALVIGERREWRLPEIAELAALYDPKVDGPCGERRCHLDPAIRLGDPYVWSATPRGTGMRFYFDFAYGNSLSPSVSPRLIRRVLCVRAGR
jgi:hypothetical protein